LLICSICIKQILLADSKYSMYLFGDTSQQRNRLPRA
jgi:hypothetical protein